MRLAIATTGSKVFCGRGIASAGLGKGSRRRLARRLACPAGLGFTLIEVLVVVAIIALLVGILLPSLQQARRQSRWTLCLSNLHQISVALFSYQTDYRGQPPRWQVYNEHVADGMALWVQGVKNQGHATRLGMLYPRYVGKEENVFYCPDAQKNRLLAKAENAYYPWKNYGTNTSWAYGSYEYRPRYALAAGKLQWEGASFDKFRNARRSIAADAFAGTWDTFGPYPAHTPIQNGPKMLYYNVAYMDGSAKGVKDFLKDRGTGMAFGSRAGPNMQQRPGYSNTDSRGSTRSYGPEFTPLRPGPENSPLPTDPVQLQKELLGNHIERGWSSFDR